MPFVVGAFTCPFFVKLVSCLTHCVKSLSWLQYVNSANINACNSRIFWFALDLWLPPEDFQTIYIFEKPTAPENSPSVSSRVYATLDTMLETNYISASQQSPVPHFTQLSTRTTSQCARAQICFWLRRIFLALSFGMLACSCVFLNSFLLPQLENSNSTSVLNDLHIPLAWIDCFDLASYPHVKVLFPT